MQLTHRFTVPASVDETWAAFNDIESVAGCFPGATVTESDADSFKGSVKVKLGPIALVYNGSGEFTTKDEAAHRMVIAAKGKDKRGNGTAGADVVATLAPSSSDAAATDVEVITDLAITGKPAQFGRGVIQDVSDKLLGQFIDCLEAKLSADPAQVAADPGQMLDASSPGQQAAPGSDAPLSRSLRDRPAEGSRGAAGSPVAARASDEPDDALDLGATVLPILLKTYGKQIAAALGGLVVLVWLVRRLRR